MNSNARVRLYKHAFDAIMIMYQDGDITQIEAFKEVRYWWINTLICDELAYTMADNLLLKGDNKEIRDFVIMIGGELGGV